MAIDLVVFDLGRVLVRIVGDYRDAYAAAGVVLDHVAQTPGQVVEIRQLFDAYELGRVETPAMLDRLAAAHGFDTAVADKVLSSWLCGPYEPSMQLVDELRAAGVKLACLSNTNDHHWKLMHAVDGPHCLKLDRLHHRFASHLLGLAKPDAAIYAIVERETKTPPQQILFFDDLLENIEAARARGWNAELIADDGDPASQMRRHLARYDVL